MEQDLKDIIKSSREARPTDFQSHLNDILGQRVADAIERRRQEMASVVLNQSQPEEIPIEADASEVSDEINSDEIKADEVDTQIEEPNGQDS